MFVNQLKSSYTGDYLKTYLWQGLSVSLNIISMLIVIPLLTNNQYLYGVYSVCISTSMFLNYADLGFVSAGLKYAGEAFARGESGDEIKYYGLSGVVLFIIVSIIASMYLLFSINPTFLIKSISDPIAISTASKLFLIQAVFSFSIILKRFVTGAFQIRVESYRYQRIDIVGSLIKIISAFYFLSPDRFSIVGYYLFINIINTCVIFAGILMIQNRYQLSLIKYFKAWRIDREIFIRTKDLALNSLFITLMWILYYELDIIMISRFLGPNSVAIYSIAFTAMKFLRSISSITFSPFQNRYNHFVGLGDIKGLKTFLKNIVQFTMPIYIFTVFSIILLSNNLVLTWVGDEYSSSAIILSILGVNFMYSFIMVPGANILRSLLRIREMYWINIVIVVVFWFGVFVLVKSMGINAFAISKLIAGTVAMIYYLNFILGYLGLTIFEFVKNSIKNYAIPIVGQILFCMWIKNYLPIDQNPINMLFTVGSGVIGALIGFTLLYLTAEYYKKEYNRLILSIVERYLR
jgi:O-antigen/teichoic acid export membrane protein